MSYSNEERMEWLKAHAGEVVVAIAGNDKVLFLLAGDHLMDSDRKPLFHDWLEDLLVSLDYTINMYEERQERYFQALVTAYCPAEEGEG